jgi:hypothetical protein
MIQMLIANNIDVSKKCKIMQALRNLAAGCGNEWHLLLTNHPLFVPWLLRSCVKNVSNPSSDDRMMHVQTLGVLWNLCKSPDSAAKLLSHGIFDALTIVLEMPYSDTHQIALLALADIASTESGRLRLLDSRLAVCICGLAKGLPPPTGSVLECIMRVLFALSETEQVKNKYGKLHTSTTGTVSAVNLSVDEHFFRSMGLIDVVGFLLRNGGELTKLLALGDSQY